MIFQLNNPIKNFQWGCKKSFSDLFNIANPKQQPQAEIWMGAHPNGSSKVYIDGKECFLNDAIDSNPCLWLGDMNEKFSGKLPFLVKILAADHPLSLQVHPNKRSAELGFTKENAKGIDIGSPERNYKDTNHKPEFVYAITHYKAMNGFRELNYIHKLFSVVNLPSIRLILEPFLIDPTKHTLKKLFESILLLDAFQREKSINELLNTDISGDYDKEVVEALRLIRELSDLYPNDVGVFSPLFLNVIELKPGEAMFLYAETPHAYLKGVGVEVMANSDNVLRAGLTSKYIDVPELIANTNFTSIRTCDLLLKEHKEQGRLTYNIPVDDFNVEIFHYSNHLLVVSSPEILLCLEGSVIISWLSSRVVLKKGESVVVPAELKEYTLNCNGVLVRTFC